MKKVAKLVMIDENDSYLMMYRSDHPTLGRDADLPGGTHEEGETTTQTVIREVEEETGVIVSDVQEVYAGLDYSTHGTHKSLFMAKLEKRPEIVMSWEHSAYEWISKEAFLDVAKNAKDDYMHMVYEVMSR